jgi:hypothetical protein
MPAKERVRQRNPLTLTGVANRRAAVTARVERLASARPAEAAALRIGIRKELEAIKTDIFGHGPNTSPEAGEIAVWLARIESHLAMPTPVEEEAQRADAFAAAAKKSMDILRRELEGVEPEGGDSPSATKPLERITRGEIATRFKVSVPTVGRWIKRGLPVRHRAKNSLFGNWDEIDGWVRALPERI